ncbi:MAG: TIGR02678 family protein [Actinomycetia bacterium]|nr:TIGR02678 family protein [Actinomycetes bacterium]
MTETNISPDTVDDARHRVATGVRSVELHDYQQLVRSLLVRPFVRPTETDRLRSVRRWEHQLRTDFEQHLDYRLEVLGTCARLIKRPTRLDPTHGAVTRTGRPFDPRRYAYLSLLLATLLRSGTQVLLSDLADRLKSDAAAIDGLDFGTDVHSQRTSFIDAIRWLEQAEALVLRDGATDSAIGAEALYDVDDEVVHLLTPSLGLRNLSSIDEVFSTDEGRGRDGRRLRRRQRIVRRVVEEPSVLLGDLDDEETAYLRRAAPVVSEDVERLTGMQLERRAEGVALVDTAGGGSDRVFPGAGSASQLALLLADWLTETGADGRITVSAGRTRRHSKLVETIDSARRESPDRVDDDRVDDDRSPAWMAMPPSGWTMSEIEATVTAIVESTPGVKRELRDDPVAATRAAVEELEAFGLAARIEGPSGDTTLVAVAPIWRFRSQRTDAADTDQLDLFGTVS